MSKPRLVQHRVQRDTSTRETAELKRENQQLKRQVARLRKQLSVEDEEEVAQESDNQESEKGSVKRTCPECASRDLASVITPLGKVRYSCKSCKKWRGSLDDSL